jgi:hypothetical protein
MKPVGGHCDPMRAGRLLTAGRVRADGSPVRSEVMCGGSAGAVVAGDRHRPIPELWNRRNDPEVVGGVGRQREAAVDVVRRVRALRRHAAAVRDVSLQSTHDHIPRDRRTLLGGRRLARRLGLGVGAARHHDMCALLVLQLARGGAWAAERVALVAPANSP